MRIYVEPEIKVINFEIEDIVTAGENELQSGDNLWG